MTNLPIGARVLVGTLRYTMPGDWWLATVLWTDGEEILVRQCGIAGMNQHNQLHPVSSIRAVGDYAFLRDFQEKAYAATKALVDAKDEAERSLGLAREAVWARLDDIGATVPGYEAPGVRTARRRRSKVGVGP